MTLSQIGTIEEALEALKGRERAVGDWWVLVKRMQRGTSDRGGSFEFDLKQHFQLWEAALRNRKRIYQQMISIWRDARPDQTELFLKKRRYSQPSPWLSEK